MFLWEYPISLTFRTYKYDPTKPFISPSKGKRSKTFGS